MDLDAALDLMQSTVAVIAGGRVISLRLRKEFPALLGYLLFLAAENFLLAVLDRNSRPYFWAYVVLVPLEHLVCIFVVRDLLNLIFTNYPGIRTIGKWAMYAGIAVSFIVSAVATNYFWYAGSQGRRKWGLFYIEIAQRAIVITLVIVILLILFALSRYPLQLSRNVYISFGFFSVMFLSDAARLFIDAATREMYNGYADVSESLVVGLCLCGWALTLRPETATITRVAFHTPHEEHLLRQLDDLNQLLARAARR